MRKLLFIPLMSLVWNTFAQDSTAAAKPDGALTVSGYIDAYYNHAFNNPKSGSLLGNGGGGSGRAFDRTTDQISLGLVQIKTAYSSSKVDIVADLTFGPNAELGNFGNLPVYNTLNGWKNPTTTMMYGTSASIKQAYGTWKATDKLSFTVGQFGTHIGYEVIDAPVNYHYSLSNLFNNGPFYHVGAKVNYTVSDKIALMAGIVNNWDNLFDNNKQKSVVAQLYVKPADGFNVYLNYIGGDGDDPIANIGYFNANAAPKSYDLYNRHLYDLTTGYQLTDKFYLGLNAAYGYYVGKNGYVTDSIIGPWAATNPKYDDGKKTTLDWGGFALYTNYAISDVVGIGVRYEYFEDAFGVRYIGGFGGFGKSVNNSLTVTAPITLANGNFILKPEFRFDGNDFAIYEDKDGMAVKEQKTIGLATIFKF